MRPAGLLVLVAALAWPAASAAATTPGCRLSTVAEWPVRLDRGLPLTAGSVNGRPVSVMIDTGASATVITTAAAERLGLTLQRTGARMRAIGGDTRVYQARIAELRIGGASHGAMRVRVAGEHPIPGVDVIVGEDVLHAFDLEFDFAKGMVRAFDAQDCKGAWLAYWDANAQVLPVEYDTSAVRIPLSINGERALALLDSGASRTLVSLAFARQLGVAPGAPGVSLASCASGLGAGVVQAWSAHFDRVQLAGETIRDARIAFADFTLAEDWPLEGAPALLHAERNPDVLLGTDFLRAHRVLVARSQDRVYFTYLGGSVFPATPPARCEERRMQ